MTIVTLTTDFGHQDYYVGRVKGELLKAFPDLQLIDITHLIEPYDIVRAAFMLKNAYPGFPEGTIHLVSVNDFYAPKAQFIALHQDGQYFIGPDNGIFSLVFPNLDNPVYQLKIPKHIPFPLGQLFAKAVMHIAAEKPFFEIGLPLDTIAKGLSLQPVTSTSTIRGTVIHVDRYENAIVNVEKELFYRIGDHRPFELYFKRHDPILQLSKYYHDVPVGEALCLFNSSDLLEIAINMGKASTLLGLKVDDAIQIDFHSKK